MAPLKIAFIVWLSIAITSVICSNTAHSTDLFRVFEANSSPNPVGSGARALGMGGAFIAIADDATAASWNPAGLFRLKYPEISFVGAAFHRIEDNEFGRHPESSGANSVTKNDMNYFSAAYPFNLFNRNMVVSVNYQNLYDFNRRWNFTNTIESEKLSGYQTIEYDQAGSLSAIGIAWCIEITPQLSFGATFNTWNNLGLFENQWEKKIRQSGSGVFDGNNFTFEYCEYERYALSGHNMNVGVMWHNLQDTFSIGVVFKSQLKAELEHEHMTATVQTFGQKPPENYTKTEKLDMPMSYGIGIAYRFSDDLTATMDIYRTEWDDFVHTNYEDDEISPITGQNIQDSDIDPTTQVRIGVEYRVKRPEYIIPLCGGLFYDPGPAEGSPDNYYGFSMGSGIKRGRYVFYAAYQFRWGNNVGAHILRDWEFEQDLREHTLYSSIVVHF